jgi:pantoate--beta-alanine ligase
MDTMPLLSAIRRIRNVDEMKNTASQWRAEGLKVALVPTMGALHRGHVQLIKRAQSSADKVVVSIFINPLQFGPGERLDAYPRNLERDEALCMEHGVDALFMPEVDSLYPEGFSTCILEEAISQSLCGVSRPQYFKGISTVAVILMNIVQPHSIVLGQNGAQRIAVIQKVVRDLHIPVEIIVGPVVRDENGLLMSSRSDQLQEHQRRDGVKLYEALLQGKRLIDEGVTSSDRIMAEVTHHLAGSPYVRVIHVSLVDRERFQLMRTVVPGKGILVVAAWLDRERWVDNILV